MVTTQSEEGPKTGASVVIQSNDAITVAKINAAGQIASAIISRWNKEYSVMENPETGKQVGNIAAVCVNAIITGIK